MGLNLFVVLSFSIVAAMAEVRQGLIARYYPLDDKSITDFIISSTIKKRLADCGALCVSVDTCESFFYNNVTGECQLHEALFMTPNGTADREGLQYHYMIKERNDWCPMGKGFQLLKDDQTCVKFHTIRTTWYEANQTCASYSPSTRLVVLDNPEKNELVKAARRAIIDMTNASLWIGLSEYTQGYYRWMDGSDIVFADWSSKDMSDLAIHDCVQLQKNKNWQWVRLPCIRVRHFICEAAVDVALYDRMMDIN